MKQEVSKGAPRADKPENSVSPRKKRPRKRDRKPAENAEQNEPFADLEKEGIGGSGKISAAEREALFRDRRKLRLNPAQQELLEGVQFNMGSELVEWIVAVENLGTPIEPMVKIAFQDRSEVTATESKFIAGKGNGTEARAIAEMAELRGWESVKVNGSKAFQDAVWMECKLRGIEVEGYKPSPLAEEMYKNRLNDAAGNRLDQVLEQSTDTAPSAASSTPTEEQPSTRKVGKWQFEVADQQTNETKKDRTEPTIGDEQTSGKPKTNAHQQLMMAIDDDTPEIHI